MLLNVLRALFVVVVTIVAMNYAEQVYVEIPPLAILCISVGAACVVVGLDIFVPQKSLLAISGVFFGLVVGMLIAYAVGLIVNLLVDAYRPDFANPAMISTAKVLIGIVACYLSISFILQTKDDVRFVIPYVEFARERKGQHPMILDTSAIIDGRVADILSTWPLDCPVIIPRFVLQELQTIADSNDRLKRQRGRRGLDVVNRLQALPRLEVQIRDSRPGEDDDEDSVDLRLVSLARAIDGRLLTTDYNLNKVAQIRGVTVININDLVNALKPVFLPGEGLQVKIIRPGEAPGQGVGYLEDGTMVVVEAARECIGQTIAVVVTSVLQTSAGRMVFGRINGQPPPERPRRRPGDPPQPHA